MADRNIHRAAEIDDMQQRRRWRRLSGAAVVAEAAAEGDVDGGRRSDIRLKQDIIPLVRLNNGLELYRFRFKGGDHTPMWG